MLILLYLQDKLDTCVYWKPELYDNTWKQDGCRKKIKSDNNLLICECNHLTAFAIMDISRDLVRSIRVKILEFERPLSDVIFTAQKTSSFIIIRMQCLQINITISTVIISMTKLLDADWLRGVQLFH